MSEIRDLIIGVLMFGAANVLFAIGFAMTAWAIYLIWKKRKK